MTVPLVVSRGLRSRAGRLVGRAGLPARKARAVAQRTGSRARPRGRHWPQIALFVILAGNYSIIILGLIAAAAGAALIPSFLGGGGGSIFDAPKSVTGIPTVVLKAYEQVAADTQKYAPGCTGMRWQILAGIGQIESGQAAGRTIADDGEITPNILGLRLDGQGGKALIVDTDGGRWDHDPEYDRAVGPMQFIPSSWASMGRDGNGDGVADPNNIYDASAGTVVHLCGKGPINLADRTQLSRAIFKYNHSDAYVTKVLNQIDTFSGTCGTTSIENSAGTDADEDSDADSDTGSAATDGDATGQAIVAFACAQQGKPYVWGGNGDPGFDCSGLTHAAYASVGIQIPRTAQTQYDAQPLLPPGSPHQPGDLLFFGIPTNIHHVGISLGGTMMIDAPDFGRTVQPRDFSGFPDYAGSARPRKTSTTPTEGAR